MSSPADSRPAAAPPSFTDRFDLASVRLGGAVLVTNDDFFAEKENLLRPEEAIWKEHAYTDRGKWMDGWESRRKRASTPGEVVGPDDHDWAIIRLGVPGVVRGVLVDTAFFRGNYPDACSIEGCAAPIDARVSTLTANELVWTPLLARSSLKGDSKNYFEVTCPGAMTHVRLRIFPDGGVARLRVYGDVIPDFRRWGHARGELDLAAVEHGGDVLSCSDMFFGERRNLVMPGRAKNMSDGWETRRRRGQGSDWAIVRLGATGKVTRVEIDTNHFIGNYPDTCMLDGISAPNAKTPDLATESAGWRPLLGRVKLDAHTRHYFETELADLGPISHVRLRVHPDGGVSRLRVFGVLDESERMALGVRRLDTLPEPDAASELRSACASTKWVRAMLDARPFTSAERVFAAADSAWASTSADDWHEAFRAHPRIGEKKAAAAVRPDAQAWSGSEQSGMNAADTKARSDMAEANRAYEERFGFVYIVCATGLSADELLSRARMRLGNTADEELRTAAEEQHAITHLRLKRILEP